MLVFTNSSYGTSQVCADEAQPVVGRPLPDFTLNSVTYYSQPTISLKDLKGKWFVMDFWASFCVPCIRSLPKIDLLEERFKDKIQFIMVGMIGERSGDKLESLEAMYDKLRIKHDLDLVMAYDSTLSLEWDIWAVPTIIVVDPNGIVRALTDSITEKEIITLLGGGTIDDEQYRQGAKPSDDPDSHVLLSTVLAKNTNEDARNAPLAFEKVDGKCVFKLQKIPLLVLYRYAYFGKYGWDLVSDSLYGKVYPVPTLQLTDTSAFEYSFQTGATKGLYNYIVKIDKCDSKDREYLMEVMQEDLKRYFGFRASVETREMPCYKLVVTSSASADKLRTKGGDGRYPRAEAAGFTVKNIPVKLLLSIIAKYHAGKQMPLVDETDIDYNIDITVDAVMTDFNDVRRALRLSGLDLIPSQRRMRVLIIRDPA